jgi:hypothetical protein
MFNESQKVKNSMSWQKQSWQKQSWQKQGRVFSVNNNFDWMVSHSQVPIAIIFENRFRVFFATRNASGKSQIALVDLDLHDPKKILSLHPVPVLGLGKPGTFDEDGVMPSSILKKGNEIWLYYTGWNQKHSTPYHNAIGLAVSYDGGYVFKRLSDGPILDRNFCEPYLVITPHVMLDEGLYKMWYASGVEWVKVSDKFEPVYVIKTATSSDGMRWDRVEKACIIQAHLQEALCAPSVIKDLGRFRMWFSCRSSKDFRGGRGSYRIGYAESINGLDWKRMDDKAGIDISLNGWDSTMLCYPNILSHNDQFYMFYNGNNFGREGFGYSTM